MRTKVPSRVIRGGGVRIADILRIDPRCWGRDDMTLGLLLSLAYVNPTQRFQIAVQEVPLKMAEQDASSSALRGAGDDISALRCADVQLSALRGVGSGAYVHYAIRACSGHSLRLAQIERLCDSVPREKAKWKKTHHKFKHCVN